VSTAWRQSSACVCSPPWYFETLVFDKEDHAIEQCGGHGSVRQALKAHCALVRQLEAEHAGEYAPFEAKDYADEVFPVTEEER